jgi:hypothetical protein
MQIGEQGGEEAEDRRPGMARRARKGSSAMRTRRTRTRKTRRAKRAWRGPRRARGGRREDEEGDDILTRDPTARKEEAVGILKVSEISLIKKLYSSTGTWCFAPSKKHVTASEMVWGWSEERKKGEGRRGEGRREKGEGEKGEGEKGGRKEKGEVRKDDEGGGKTPDGVTSLISSK